MPTRPCLPCASQPLHVPRIAEPLFRPVVRKERTQQVALAMPARAPSPLQQGWKPMWSDYLQVQDQITQAWNA